MIHKNEGRTNERYTCNGQDETTSIVSVSITVCTVAQNYCKGDSPCQWKTPIFRNQGSKTPEPIDIKFDRVITSGTTPHTQTLVFLPLRGAGLHMRVIVIIRVYFLHLLCLYCLAHLHRSHRLTDFRDLWLNRRVFALSTFFLGCEKKFHIFHYFPQKKQRKLQW